MAKSDKFPGSFLDANQFNGEVFGIDRMEIKLTEALEELAAFGRGTKLSEVKEFISSDLEAEYRAAYHKHLSLLPKIAPKKLRDTVKHEYNLELNGAIPIQERLRNIFECGYIFCEKDGGISIDKEKTIEELRKKCTQYCDAEAIGEYWKRVQAVRAAVDDFRAYEDKIKVQHLFPSQIYPRQYTDERGFSLACHTVYWLLGNDAIPLDADHFFAIVRTDSAFVRPQPENKTV